jgi:hypothetical protein
MICLKCMLPLIDTDAHYGLHKDCFTAVFKASPESEFISLTRRHSSDFIQDEKNSYQNTSFFHGRFKKYSADLEGNSYILKMRENDAPELPEVEYLCNQIGEYLEIPVADFFIINFEEEKVFVTKNFIKRGAPIDLQHIYHHREESEHSCEDLIRIIGEKTGRPYDVGIFIQTLLFDALIGNHDRHGKNLALIVTSGDTSLSPIYDNVSYLGLEKGSMLKADFNPTGKICTKHTTEPSMKDYVEELIRLDHKDHVFKFHSKINLPFLVSMIEKSFCSELMKLAIKNLIVKRFKELVNELQV